MPTERLHQEGSFHYRFDFDQNICYVTGAGRINLSLTKQAMNQVKDDPAFIDGMEILVDLRYIYFHPTYGELMAIKDHLVSLKDNYNSRIAIVINDELYYVALLVSKLTQAVGINMFIFKNYEKAQSWLISKANKTISS